MEVTVLKALSDFIWDQSRESRCRGTVGQKQLVGWARYCKKTQNTLIWKMVSYVSSPSLCVNFEIQCHNFYSNKRNKVRGGVEVSPFAGW